MPVTNDCMPHVIKTFGRGASHTWR